MLLTYQLYYTEDAPRRHSTVRSVIKSSNPYSNVSCSQTKQTIVSRSAGIPLDITQGVLLLDVIVSFFCAEEYGIRLMNAIVCKVREQ